MCISETEFFLLLKGKGSKRLSSEQKVQCGASN